MKNSQKKPLSPVHTPFNLLQSGNQSPETISAGVCNNIVQDGRTKLHRPHWTHLCRHSLSAHFNQIFEMLFPYQRSPEFAPVLPGATVKTPVRTIGALCQVDYPNGFSRSHDVTSCLGVYVGGDVELRSHFYD